MLGFQTIEMKMLCFAFSLESMAVSGNTMKYTSADVTKLTRLTPVLDRVEVQSSLSGVSLNKAARLDKCRKLIQIAEKSLRGETDYYYGIDACNEVLDGHGCEIGPTLMHECLCIRASLLLKGQSQSSLNQSFFNQGTHLHG